MLAKQVTKHRQRERQRQQRADDDWQALAPKAPLLVSLGSRLLCGMHRRGVPGIDHRRYQRVGGGGRFENMHGGALNCEVDLGAGHARHRLERFFHPTGA